MAASPALASGVHHSSKSAHSHGLASGRSHLSATTHPSASAHARTSASSHSTVAASVHARRGHAVVVQKTHVLHGQQSIQPDRVTEIQQALVREHYLSEEPNGQWDAATQSAMQKYQAEQGWQTKLMPDSRALKKLGLGPDYSSAINAKTAAFVDPPPITSIPSSQAAGFAAASRTER